ncbi:MAG: DUF2089 domain-containing protein [Candidatus Cloacimonadota bacterium]|nr:MAG: DUF2089 domain-containing protein [Candidatus Cloacimonadota bacterium]
MIMNCPVCHGVLEIREFGCNKCDVTIRGRFPFSNFFRLSPGQMEFVRVFLKSRGNIKEVEKEVGLSYPTVRGKLNDVLKSLGMEPDTETLKREEILDSLSKGEIDAEEAVEQLKKM